MAKLWSDSLNSLCLVGYFLLKTPILGGEIFTHVQLHRGHQGGGGQGEAAQSHLRTGTLGDEAAACPRPGAASGQTVILAPEAEVILACNIIVIK